MSQTPALSSPSMAIAGVKLSSSHICPDTHQTTSQVGSSPRIRNPRCWAHSCLRTAKFYHWLCHSGAASFLASPWLIFLVVVQLLSRVQLFVTPWTAARQASLSFTILLKLMPIELVMLSNHLILCRPLLLLPSVFPILILSLSERIFMADWCLLAPQPGFWTIFPPTASPASSACFCCPRDGSLSPPHFLPSVWSLLSLQPYPICLTSSHEFWEHILMCPPLQRLSPGPASEFPGSPSSLFANDTCHWLLCVLPTTHHEFLVFVPLRQRSSVWW